MKRFVLLTGHNGQKVAVKPGSVQAVIETLDKNRCLVSIQGSRDLFIEESMNNVIDKIESYYNE